MKLTVRAVSLFFVTMHLFSACQKTDKGEPLRGVWILNSVRHMEGNGNLKYPAGFNFYSPDSVEVYGSPLEYDRFSNYDWTGDSVLIHSFKRIWSAKSVLAGDSLKMFFSEDSVIYVRVPIPITEEHSRHLKRLVLSADSWGSFLSVVLYPDGKTLVANGTNRKGIEYFNIRNSGNLFHRLNKSYEIIRELEKTEVFENFRQLTEVIMLDGIASNFLQLGDSISNSTALSLPNLKDHHLGLVYYGLMEAIRPQLINERLLVDVQFQYDSIRPIALPYFRSPDNFDLNHAEKILLMESLNTRNRISPVEFQKLPYQFELEHFYERGNTKIRTNGKIFELFSGTDSMFFKADFSVASKIKVIL